MLHAVVNTQLTSHPYKAGWAGTPAFRRTRLGGGDDLKVVTDAGQSFRHLRMTN